MPLAEPLREDQHPSAASTRSDWCQQWGWTNLQTESWSSPSPQAALGMLRCRVEMAEAPEHSLPAPGRHELSED